MHQVSLAVNASLIKAYYFSETLCAEVIDNERVLSGRVIQSQQSPVAFMIFFFVVVGLITCISDFWSSLSFWMFLWKHYCFVLTWAPNMSGHNFSC